MSIDIEKVKSELKKLIIRKHNIAHGEKVLNGIKALKQQQAEIEKLKKLINKDTECIARQQIELERLKSNQLPLELTAENGAKGLLSGEFHELQKVECPECYLLTEPFEDCDICKGFGAGYQKIIVSWTTIKDIYKKWVDYRLPKPPEGEL